MVKVQKPSPKSIKKDISAKMKKPQMKKTAEKSANKKNSNVEKTLKAVTISKDGKINKPQISKNAVKSTKNKVANIEKLLKTHTTTKVVKDNKKKNADVIKKSKTMQKDTKVFVPKKKPLGSKIQVSSKNSSSEMQEITKSVEPNNIKESVQNDKLQNINESVGKQKTQSIKKAIQKKRELGAKIQVNLKKGKTIASDVQDIKKSVKKRPLIQKGNKIKGTDEVIQEILNEEQNKNLESEKKIEGPIYEPEDFDEEKFNDIVCFENVHKICEALKVLVEKQVSEKKTSIFSDYRYHLNVASYKIPNCPKRVVKLNLKHSLVDTKKDDVVIIVPDLKRGAKVDYEPTIQKFEDVLREIGEDNIKVVPFNQLRNEYSSFEAKRNFSNAYDYFLCDGRIVGHVTGFLGKYFQKPRSTLHAVHLNNPKMYKNEIHHALKRTSYKQIHKGDLFSIPVGNHRFTINQLTENIDIVIKQLKTLFPGGYANIRNIYIKIDIQGTSALPLYVSMAGPPLEVPNIIGPREQRMIKLKKQANDILSKFSMSKTGDFVRLNKTQIRRKQEIREGRKSLLSEKQNEVDENNPPVKKAFKKDKRYVSHVKAGKGDIEDCDGSTDNEDSDTGDNE